MPDEKSISLPDEEEKESAIEKRERLEKNLEAAGNAWGHSSLGLEGKKAAMTMLSTKTGMYAKIPIVCKGDDCPYAESCKLLPYDLAPIGEYCPMETAEIELRFKGYCDDFNIEDASFTDRNLIAQIVNCDIMMERAQALMSNEGVSVVDVVAGISEDGQEFYRPEISKAWELYERTSKKRNEAYNLMMATRKDRRADSNDDKSLTEKLREALNQEVKVDQRPVEFQDLEEIYDD